MNHCPNCECPSCQEYFQEKADHEERERMFKQWNWNYSPAEVAQELAELMGSGAWYDEDEVFEHMAEFFDEETVDCVRDCYEVFC